MRYQNLSVEICHVERSLSVRDHLFDVMLTPDEALALLGWLLQNKQQLEALRPIDACRTPAVHPSRQA